MTTRKLERVIASIPASDGAGVKLRRSLGASQLTRHDPFLMLDEFFSDNPDDYLAGFPAHPHRGFETVTYMLDGHMQHKDNHGNTGDLGPGDVQWMSAARGIIHSEMPQQSEGPHARLPALAEPAGEGEDEAGGVPRHSGERDSRRRESRGEGEGHRRSARRDRAARSTAEAPIRTTSTCTSRRVQCSRRRCRPSTTPSCMCTRAMRWSAKSASRCAASQRRVSCPPEIRSASHARRRRAQECWCSPAGRCASRSCNTDRS